MSPLVLQALAVLLGSAAFLALGARHLWRRRRIRSLLLALAALVWGAGAVLISLRLVFPCAPTLCLLGKAVEAAERRTLVQDRDGSVIAALEPGLTPWVPLDEFPPYVLSAVLQREDRRFASHRGVDPVGVIRASFTLAGPGRPEGASTVPMQVAQCVVGRFGPERLPPEERFSGKLAEVAVGANLVHRLGHDRTLELYLNCVPLRGGRGLEAAARFNFGVGIRDVSLQQALLLAAMIRAPGATNPVDNPERARAEVRRFAEGLVRRGVLDPEVLKTLTAGLGLEDRRYSRTPVSDPVQVLREEVGSRPIRTSIRSSLHRDLQQRAWDETHRFLASIDRALDSDGVRPQAVFVALDHEGRILAYLGGRADVGVRGYDRVRDARVQLASTEKPFLLADGIERRRINIGQSVDELRCPEPSGDPWLTRIHGASNPARTLSEAMAHSDNWMAVCLLSELGRTRGGVARSAGLPPYRADDLSTALGTGTVSPLALAHAWTHLVTGVLPPDPRLSLDGESTGWVGRIPLLRRVTPIVADARDRLDRIRGIRPDWSESTVEQVRLTLEEVVEAGTGRAAQPLRADGRRVGLKTGTATGEDGRAREMLVVGYVNDGEDLVVGLLWLGFDTPAPLPLSGGAARHLVPVWTRIMAAL